MYVLPAQVKWTSKNEGEICAIYTQEAKWRSNHLKLLLICTATNKPFVLIVVPPTYQMLNLPNTSSWDIVCTRSLLTSNDFWPPPKMAGQLQSVLCFIPTYPIWETFYSKDDVLQVSETNIHTHKPIHKNTQIPKGM